MKKMFHTSSFTLIEMLMVVAVIIILVGTIVGTASYVTQKRAETSTQALIKLLDTALQQYEQDKGYFPPCISVSGDTAYGSYYRFYLDRFDGDDNFKPNWNSTAENATNPNLNLMNYLKDSIPFIQKFAKKRTTQPYYYYMSDAFANPLFYANPGVRNSTSFDLGSMGGDSRPGNTTALTVQNFTNGFGKADDITNFPAR